MEDPRIAVIVNPRAGRERVRRELPRLVSGLRSSGARFHITETSAPGHATVLAGEAADDGADMVVAVGGDGTVHEVVNGLIRHDRPRGRAALAVVAAGSGCDFARTFDLPQHVPNVLFDGRRRRLDVGKIECMGAGGTLTRYFINVAEAGLGAATVQRAQRLPRWMGRGRYLIAFWPTLARFHPAEVAVTADGAPHVAVAHNVVIANCRYFGGGMHISPKSEPDDGRLEVQISVGPKRQAFTLIPKIYRGTHLPHPGIAELFGADIGIDGALPVEADGENVGTTPARFTVLPRMLELAT